MKITHWDFSALRDVQMDPSWSYGIELLMMKLEMELKKHQMKSSDDIIYFIIYIKMYASKIQIYFI